MGIEISRYQRGRGPARCERLWRDPELEATGLGGVLSQRRSLATEGLEDTHSGLGLGSGFRRRDFREARAIWSTSGRISGASLPARASERAAEEGVIPDVVGNVCRMTQVSTLGWAVPGVGGSGKSCRAGWLVSIDAMLLSRGGRVALLKGVEGLMTVGPRSVPLGLDPDPDVSKMGPGPDGSTSAAGWLWRLARAAMLRFERYPGGRRTRS